MGTISGADSIDISIRNIDTRVVRVATTDGGGFFGLVDLDPGTYEVRARLAEESYLGAAHVDAGRVATVDLRVIYPHRRTPPR
jgi:hypothetical protein